MVVGGKVFVGQINMNKYMIKYNVIGFPSEQLAGPYNEDQIEYQQKDIEIYSGVYNVSKVLVEKVEGK